MAAGLTLFFAGTRDFPQRGKSRSATRPRSRQYAIKGEPCLLGLRYALLKISPSQQANLHNFPHTTVPDLNIEIKAILCYYIFLRSETPCLYFI